MAKKLDAFYFENLLAVAKICNDQANYLVECLENYDIDTLSEKLVKMHEFEHSADIKKHEMNNALSKAFITPIEREDLAELAANLDEVADNLEDVMQRLYMDEPKTISVECVLFAKKLAECTKAMELMFDELPNFKKPAKLLLNIVKINDFEEDCDKLYIEAYKKIKQENTDVLEIVALRKILDYLERCADACEHVADIVETIIMKNT